MCASPPSEAVQVNTGNYGVFQKALTNTEDGLAIEPRRNPSRTMHLGAPLFNQAKSNSKSMSYLHYIHTILSNTPSRVHSTDIHEITTFEFFLWSDVEPKPNLRQKKNSQNANIGVVSECILHSVDSVGTSVQVCGPCSLRSHDCSSLISTSTSRILLPAIFSVVRHLTITCPRLKSEKRFMFLGARD